MAIKASTESVGAPSKGLHADGATMLGPQFALRIEGTELKGDFNQCIESVSFESSADMADMMQIELENPGLLYSDQMGQFPNWVDHPAFQPGNEAELFAGYGKADTFIGRALLAKHLPSFPQDGMPKLTIKAYSKSHLMMDMSGEIQATQENKVKMKTVRPVNAADDQGRVYANMRASDVVAIIGAKYGFKLDIDATDRLLKPSAGDGIIQKKGLKDYEICQMLANINRREFWVDYEPKQKGWVLHWKKPADDSSPEFIFKYGAGNETTLLDYRCEYGLRDQSNEITLLAWDETLARWISVIQIEDAEGPDPRWRKGGGRAARNTPAPAQDPGVPKKASPKHSLKAVEKIHIASETDKDIVHVTASPTQFRLAAGGNAIDIPGDRVFRDLQDAADFALRWFKERKDHFMVAHGVLVGVETLRARQTHILKGLSQNLDGAYYFTRVKHNLSGANGYVIDFTARKVVL